MAALRWILLVAGLIFIGALVAWESRRGRLREDGRGDLEARPRERHLPFGTPLSAEDRLRGARTEPPLGPLDSAGLLDSPWPLDPPGDDADAVPGGVSADDGGGVGPAPAEEAPANETCAEEVAAVAAVPAGGWDDAAAEPEPEPSLWHAQPGEGVLISPVTVREPLSLELPPAPPLVVEWPPETERHIVSIQLVTRRAEPFSGRALRQALAAAGFVHGRFGIYHLPAEDGRAILSAASLSRPGVLDPENMDFRRFTGLNLFAVLPGVLTAEASLKYLLEIGTKLADRLGGRLQDEQGAPLDDAHRARLREQLPHTLASPTGRESHA